MSAELDHALRRRSDRADQRQPTRIHQRTERPYDGKTKARWGRDMILAKRIRIRYRKPYPSEPASCIASVTAA